MITVYGASDDLIEVEGDIREEFPYHCDDADGDVLAFSDGTVLRIAFTASGVWRITPVVRGSAHLHLEHAEEDDVDNYSDRATLREGITWVVHGIAHAKAKP